MLSYQKIIFSENTPLSWENPYTGGTVVREMNELMPLGEALEVMLPFASSVSLGTGFILNNISAYDVQIINLALEEIHVLTSGKVFYFYVVDNQTATGQWRVIPWGSGSTGITTMTLKSSDRSVHIDGGQITPPGGTVDMRLPSSLSGLSNLNIKGLVLAEVDSRTPLTFKTILLQEGANIGITQAEDGSLILGVNPTLTQLTSLETAGMHWEGNTLKALQTEANNGDFSLQSAGKGKVHLNKVMVDGQGNVSGIKDLLLSGALNHPCVPKAWCSFRDNGQTSNNIVLEESFGISSVAGKAGTYFVSFTTTMANAGYGFSVDLQRSASASYGHEAFVQSRTARSCVVNVRDSTHRLVSSPDAVSVMIYSL